MGAVAPIVSVGLGVASSIGAASSQQKQIDSQVKAMEAQNLIAQDQLALATQQLEAQKETAEFMAVRETTLNQAQVDQAYLAQSENEVRQQLAYTEAKSQMSQQNAAVRDTVNNLLGQTATENQQINSQSAASLEQMAQFLEDTAGIPKQMFAQFLGMTGGAAGNVSSQSAVGQASQLEGIAQYQRGMENAAASQRTTQYNSQFANQAAQLQAQYGRLNNAFNKNTLGYQMQSDVLGNQVARSDIEYTGLRNQTGIEAQKYATIGAANMAQANAMYDMQNQNAAYQASLSSLQAQSPGILSYANIAGQAFNSLNQLGIFSGSTQPSAPAGYSFNESVSFNTSPTSASFSSSTPLPSSASFSVSPSSISVPGWVMPSTTFDSNANSYGSYS